MQLLTNDYWNMRFLVLSGRRIGPFILTNACCEHVSFSCISSISLQYFSAEMVSPDFIKLHWIKVAENHQTVTITFFWWSFGFGKCRVLSASSHCAERLRLSYRIQFSLQVTIWSKKESFWLRRRRADEISKRLH